MKEVWVGVPHFGGEAWFCDTPVFSATFRQDQTKLSKPEKKMEKKGTMFLNCFYEKNYKYNVLY